MTVQSTRFLGRPVAAAPDGDVVSHDKWALVADLTTAADDFGLSHRTITVLRTMLTFVPDRHLPPLPGRSIVFASNATLGERLGGMPESTLRRHLAALVEAHIITRVDSPNRKRYAKRLGQGIACAYGFDLAPLAIMARDISARARACERRAEEHAALRSAVLVARQALCEQLASEGIDPDGVHELSPLLARTRLMLRRKNNTEALRALLIEFEAAVLSASDTENERHQHREINKNSDRAPVQSDVQNSAQRSVPSDTPSCESLTDSFTEYHRMFPQGASEWSELEKQARQLVPMMGIDLQVYEEASRIMAPCIAPIAVLCLLERFDTLKNPGGFLRHLTQRARAGELDMARLLASSGIIVS
ncbi:plasmid replication protein RepC [Thioclava indica]|uniref:Uncharacterized protein n=1 Tax=Thioclava indica TaxID=1353528 RepID=A0A074J220_9RHOB|nr:plasmid replication protein RepC [Thioclava indica]KEO51456.1 hypothetical protein DT23_09215 [Thioclava indica]